MSRPAVTTERWEGLTSFSETFTCYSAAIATWAAADDDAWARTVNPGLSLTITDEDDGLFGFAYFPPELRAELGLARTGADEPGEAVAGVLDELAVSGRVIVAGDAFHLPWHVAFERRHLPHWFVLADAPEGLRILDPFACRNELGVQTAAREPVSRESLERLLRALPNDDPMLRLRETLSFGDDTAPLDWRRYQWFVRAEVDAVRRPAGAEGPSGIRRLASHFRDRGQALKAYGQADDIWSIGRHRALLCRHAGEVAERLGDAALARWTEEHAVPLAKRWGHIAPLLMQATLTLTTGRTASASVPETLEELAAREEEAAEAFPAQLDVSRI